MDKTAKLIKALRCSDGPTEADGMGCANRKCPYRDPADAGCEIGKMCIDAADLIEQLNDFLQSEAAKLLQQVGELEQKLAAVEADWVRLMEQVRGYCMTCAFSGNCSKLDINDDSPLTWHYGDCDDWKWDDAGTVGRE